MKKYILLVNNLLTGLGMKINSLTSYKQDATNVTNVTNVTDATNVTYATNVTNVTDATNAT